MPDVFWREISKMDQKGQFLDIEVGPHDIQSLNSLDAIAAFFAKLGYNTDARTPQTAGNLGITADSTTRPIKKVELIADQESLFQVYLFELQSVTIAHTRALARAFRNRAGNYLLILTSDPSTRATASGRGPWLGVVPSSEASRETTKWVPRALPVGTHYERLDFVLLEKYLRGQKGDILFF